MNLVNFWSLFAKNWNLMWDFNKPCQSSRRFSGLQEVSDLEERKVKRQKLERGDNPDPSGWKDLWALRFFSDFCQRRVIAPIHATFNFQCMQTKRWQIRWVLCQVEVKRPVSIPAPFRLLTASDHCTDPYHIQLSMHANSTLTDPVGAVRLKISYLISKI